MGKNMKKIVPPKPAEKVVTQKQVTPAKTTPSQNQRGKTKSKGSKSLTR